MGVGKGAAELYCSLHPSSCVLPRQSPDLSSEKKGEGEVTALLWFPPRALLFCRECRAGAALQPAVCGMEGAAGWFS